MYSSFFFIPSDKPRFVEKSSFLQADYFIFDMEESVSDKALSSCVGNLKSLTQIKENFYVRIPNINGNYKSTVLLVEDLFQLNFRVFLLPKLNTYRELKSFIDYIPKELLKKIKFGILVESPSMLIDFYKSACAYRESIALVLIGSHDYCNTVGCKHNDENLVYLRSKLLCECRALGLTLVDCVSTDFTDLKKYEIECIKSCNSGFDGRAIIHPKQLDVFNNAKYYTKEEVMEAIKVKQIIDKTDMASFSTLNVNGKLYEKPHLKRIYNIAEWHLKHQIYDL